MMQDKAEQSNDSFYTDNFTSFEVNFFAQRIERIAFLKAKRSYNCLRHRIYTYVYTSSLVERMGAKLTH